MSRFQPDGWLEWLARTAEMVDVAAGVYVETIAPDLRPFILCLGMIMLVITSTRRIMRGLLCKKLPINKIPTSTRIYWVCVSGWVLSWGAWLAISGNGRYALPLLVVAGPLLVVTILRLPLRQDWKWLILVAVMTLQGILLNSASPSQAWATMKSRWENNGPPRSRVEILQSFDPDVILTTESQTMSALLVNAGIAKLAHLISLDFVDAMGKSSLEQQSAISVITLAERPVLLESYNLDNIGREEAHRLLWRSRSSVILRRYGLTIVESSCIRALASINVMQVVCGLAKTQPQNDADLVPAKKAQDILSQLEEKCGSSLSPLGAMYVQPDGGIIRVYRESRYLVLATADGSLYVRWRQDINFRVRWEGLRDRRPWESLRCSDIISRS